MALKINIMPAAKDDLDEILIIENKSFTSPWSRKLFIDDLENEYSHIYLARKRITKKLCGYISFSLIHGELHVLNLAVDNKYRRKKVATSLLKYAFDFAKKGGGFVAFLEVRESHDAARALYQSLGFFDVAKRKKYYSDTGEDAVIMINFFNGDK